MNERDKNNENFKIFFDHAPLGYQSLDIDGNFIEVNQKWLDTFGYERNEVIGKWFGDFLAPEYKEAFRKNFHIFKDQGHIHSEFEMVRKNGDILFIAFEGQIGNDAEGRFKQTHCILEDITEKKKIETELKESEARYKQLVETASDAIYLISENGIILDTNITATIMLKRTKDDIVGSPIDSVDPNFPVEAFVEYWRNIPYEEQRIFETQHITSKGNLIPVEISAKKFKIGETTYYYGIARDFTERIKTENELKESEAKFRSYVDYAPDGIFIANEKGEYVEVNKSACRITGYTEDELLNLTISDLVQEEYLEKAMDHFQSLGKMGFSSSDIGFVTKNGEKRFWTVDAVKLSETRFLGFVKDITDRIQAEEELKKSEEKYRLLFENMLDGFAYHKIITDENGKAIDYIFMEINDAFEELTGLKREKIIGKKVTEIVPGIEKDTADWIRKYGEVALTDKELRFEQYSEFLDRWYSVYAFCPKKGYFATVFENITERKQAENKIVKVNRRLKISTDSAQIGIWELDLKKNLLTWDKRMFELYGIEPENFEGAYETWKKGVHPDDVERSDKEAQAAISGEKKFHTQFRVVWPDGQIRFIEAHAIVNRDPDGTPKSMIGVNWDITERKQAEEELQKHRDNLEELVKKRTKELEEKNEKLEKFNKLFVDREFRIKELKDKIIELEKRG